MDEFEWNIIIKYLEWIITKIFRYYVSLQFRLFRELSNRDKTLRVKNGIKRILPVVTARHLAQLERLRIDQLNRRRHAQANQQLSCRLS